MLTKWKRIVGFLFFWRNQMNMHKGQFLLEDHSQVTTFVSMLPAGSIDRQTNEIGHYAQFLSKHKLIFIPGDVEKALKAKNISWGDLHIKTIRQKLAFYDLHTYDKKISSEQKNALIGYMYANSETQV